MNSDATLHHAGHCANCGMTAHGNFCQDCGQETRLHVPSAREFLHEFVGHYVALEGKLWKTLALLLFKPGRLTCEYLAGRRVRFVQPLRLYLTLSIIFFALFKFTGHNGVSVNEHKPAAAAATQAHPAATASESAREEAKTPLGDHNSDMRNWLASIDPRLGERADKFDRLSAEEQNHQVKTAFFSYTPYAVFALMPLFALLLKLLYLGSGRRYGEHLLFALHSNAFAFLMLGLLVLAPGVPFLRPVLGLWLVFYLPTAMRRVYGGTRLATALRWLVLMTLHSICIGFAIAGALALAILA